MARLADLVGGLGDTARRVVRAATSFPALTWTVVLALVLGISLVLYVGYGASRVRRVLFYPDAATHKLVGEEHFIPRSPNREEGVRGLVEELMLGPAAYELSPVLPGSVSLRSLVVRGRIAYVDFSADLVIDLETVPLTLGGLLQAVANNLYFNFPRLRGVRVLVNGQVPAIEGVEATALAYAREMVR